MCSVVMSLCSHYLHVMSLNNNYYNTLINSGSTYTAPGFWMVQHQLVVWVQSGIRVLKMYYLATIFLKIQNMIGFCKSIYILLW